MAARTAIDSEGKAVDCKTDVRGRILGRTCGQADTHHWQIVLPQRRCLYARAGLRHVRGVRPNRAADLP